MADDLIERLRAGLEQLNEWPRLNRKLLAARALAEGETK